MLGGLHPQYKFYSTQFIGIPLLLFVGQYDFLQSSIGKFKSSLARPVFWKEGKVSFMAPSRNIICFARLVCRRFLF